MELFYLITWIQRDESGHKVTRSSDGLFTAREGATRLVILHQLRQNLQINGAVTFFSLVRNEL